MANSAEFWLGIAGLGYTVGTFYIGKYIGIGRKEAKLEAIEKKVDQLCEEISQINKSLVGCQLKSNENRGTISAQVNQLSNELGQMRTKTERHAENRDLHTDREWRTGSTERLEAIAASIGKRFDSLEQNMTQLRAEIKTGHNGGK